MWKKILEFVLSFFNDEWNFFIGIWAVELSGEIKMGMKPLRMFGDKTTGTMNHNLVFQPGVFFDEGFNLIIIDQNQDDIGLG